MSAAMEAAIEGIPSAGLSSLDYRFDADFSTAKIVARNIAQRMLSEQMPEHLLLNVNIPRVSEAEFKGMKLCRQAYAKWEENFDQRVDPRGKDYYWMVGRFVNMDTGTDTDVQALHEGYASVVPVKFDLTDHKTKDWMRDTWTELA